MSGGPAHDREVAAADLQHLVSRRRMRPVDALTPEQRPLIFLDDFDTTGPHTVTAADGRVWTFDFTPRFGPLLLRKDGEPSGRQPVSERHPFWEPFEKWNRERDHG